MALIVCCCVQHKLSRQASPSRFTTSANQDSNLPLLQRTDTDYKTKCQRSILKLKFYQQHQKTRFKSAELRLLCRPTSCKALKANQVNRWRAMLGKRNPSYLASYPDFYTTHSFRVFFHGSPARLQVADNSVWSHIPNYRICMSEEQADGFKSLR